MTALDLATHDRCPGVLRLHEAADGPLARVRLPGGRLDGSGLRGIAEAAKLGNGIVELTSRAGVQIRGVRDPGRCAELLAGSGLLPSASHDRVRNIIASPLAGRHADSRAETDTLVAELDRRLCADLRLAGLPGRFLFAVDDGAGLTGHAADVTLVARAPDRFAIGEAEIHRRDAAAAAVEAARAFLAGHWTRQAQLAGATVSVGMLLQRDGRAALTVMPRLARIDPETVMAIADLADDVRVSTARTLTLVDRDPGTVDRDRSALERLGLITDPVSSWVGLTACAGEGACTKARYEVRAAAAARAAQRGPGAPREHYAGCERVCGRPAGATVVIDG